MWGEDIFDIPPCSRSSLLLCPLLPPFHTFAKPASFSFVPLTSSTSRLSAWGGYAGMECGWSAWGGRRMEWMG